MGLIKAAIGAAGGVLGDQWKEFFYCDSLNETILMPRAKSESAGSAAAATRPVRTTSFPTARASPSTTASA